VAKRGRLKGFASDREKKGQEARSDIFEGTRPGPMEGKTSTSSPFAGENGGGEARSTKTKENRRGTATRTCRSSRSSSNKEKERGGVAPRSLLPVLEEM